MFILEVFNNSMGIDFLRCKNSENSSINRVLKFFHFPVEAGAQRRAGTVGTGKASAGKYQRILIFTPITTYRLANRASLIYLV
ncbi:hypothetical protein [Burkholderia ubonensis]|uniref:hypothetical protein n=1 Tax=Burkholderia ubonensis TaxID=101571 RepID=UPI0012FA286E|nr:hypothetical protein [Burkholderia ubonensis]